MTMPWTSQMRDGRLQPRDDCPPLTPVGTAPVDLYLLVIAHPDDESMFFSPTIRSILSALGTCVPPAPAPASAPAPPAAPARTVDSSLDAKVSASSASKFGVTSTLTKLCVLSLSNGGYGGLGQIRAEEMRMAALALGLLRRRGQRNPRRAGLAGNKDGLDDISDERDDEMVVTVLDDDRMKDGPDETWDDDVVARAVMGRIQTILLGTNADAAEPYEVDVLGEGDGWEDEEEDCSLAVEEGNDGSDEASKSADAAGGSPLRRHGNSDADDDGDGHGNGNGNGSRDSDPTTVGEIPAAVGNGETVVGDDKVAPSTLSPTADVESEGNNGERQSGVPIHRRQRRRRRVVIVTFDSGGVSGHPNHVAAHRGVRRLLSSLRRWCAQSRCLDRYTEKVVVGDDRFDKRGAKKTKKKATPDRCCLRCDVDLCAYELVTIRNPLVKYLPLLDLVWMALAFLFRLMLYFLGVTTSLTPPPAPALPFAQADPTASCETSKAAEMHPPLPKRSGRTRTTAKTIVYRTFEPRVVWSAMAAHATQFVWYRRLSVLFSRYTYRNELRPMHNDDDDNDALSTPNDDDKERPDSNLTSVSVDAVRMPRVVEVVAERTGDSDGTAAVGNDGRVVLVIPPILRQCQMLRIADRVLPSTIRIKRWTRLYSLARDGDSFLSFRSKMGTAEPSLLVVKTNRSSIFGAYVDASWNLRGGEFYGGGTACLWRFVRGGRGTGREKGEEEEDLKVFRWTGRNRCVQLCDPSRRMIGLGGGGKEGAFGLCLSGDFLRGTTGRCDTFDNDPLCDEEDGRFDVLDVECWGFRAAFR